MFRVAGVSLRHVTVYVLSCVRDKTLSANGGEIAGHGSGVLFGGRSIRFRVHCSSGLLQHRSVARRFDCLRGPMGRDDGRVSSCAHTRHMCRCQSLATHPEITRQRENIDWCRRARPCMGFLLKDGTHSSAGHQTGRLGVYAFCGLLAFKELREWERVEQVGSEPNNEHSRGLIEPESLAAWLSWR